MRACSTIDVTKSVHCEIYLKVVGQKEAICNIESDEHKANLLVFWMGIAYRAYIPCRFKIKYRLR